MYLQCKDLLIIIPNYIFRNLATNQISTLQKTTFNHLSHLERLNLNNNNISHIEEGTFLSTPNLKILYVFFF